MTWALRFHGVGNAFAVELGSAMATIERDGRPWLTIDCGGDGFTACLAHYGQAPTAWFITHTHLDHIAGFERLFFGSFFDPARRGKIRLYVPAKVVPLLHKRVAEYPNVLAEGGANFWDGFQLIPVGDHFWHDGVRLETFPTRHHWPETSYGLRLAGSVVWTGDTRPIPETLAMMANAGELVAHDCGLHGNPSHSGLDDLEREYPPTLLARCRLYHYASQADGDAMAARGYAVARPGDVLALAEPTALRADLSFLSPDAAPSAHGIVLTAVNAARAPSPVPTPATTPASDAVASPRDRLGRPLRDLRLSVIEACNFRCPYCMPADRVADDAGLDAASRLSFDEIERLVRGFVRVGVRKLRITGGEPLLRKRLPDLIARLAAVQEVEDLALTTNGSLLAPQARALRQAGLHRLTVSLDARDPAVFAALSGGRGDIASVLRGLDAAAAAGFQRIKLNCVVQRGVNDDQTLPLVEFARDNGHVARFIEYMDVGTCNAWDRARVVPSAELRDRIHARWPLRPLDAQYRGEVATRYRFLDGAGEIGFVSSISEPFCGDCHRARVSADGRLYTCLFAGEGRDLRPLLAHGGDALDEGIAALWRGRGDRYSEARGRPGDGPADGPTAGAPAGDAAAPHGARKRVEMFLVGG